jgi:hypothetical protein
LRISDSNPIIFFLRAALNFSSTQVEAAMAQPQVFGQAVDVALFDEASGVVVGAEGEEGIGVFPRHDLEG